MAAPRENWSSRSGFILAAVGSAIGLGNIWRFPYVAYENGGGAFLIPYLIALVTAGLPLLFLDYIVGQKYRGGAPIAYKRMVKSAESIGWWQVLVCSVVAIYYASVLSWAGNFMIFSLGQQWGDDTEAFFFNTYLQNADNLEFVFVPKLFIGLVVVWALALTILYGGIKKGVEFANRIFIPLLLIMFLGLVFQSLRLPGAVDGLNAFFTPNWGAMTDPKVWLAAYGHIFFSLSIGFGIMLTFASYLKPNANLTASGLVVGLANSSFEILAGIGVFAALGFMAQATGVPISEVVGSGIGLAFIAFPKLISSLGSSGDIVGFLFFGSLVIAGITSIISILEVPIAAFKDKFGWSRNKAVTIIGGTCAVISIALFSTKNAITFVDIIDNFANNIGIVVGALLSIVWITWLNRSVLPELISHVNRISSIKLGKTWVFMLTIVTPISLLVALVLTLKSLLTEGYGDYPMMTQLIFGWGIVVIFALGALLLSALKGKNEEI
ncbi:sodium-dependent transporter [Psychrobacter frigidicola]|uniref:Transporter n=1 Tax=Psychrobacter frigidicola TaxID=45611 RepID=A0A5C7A6C6_9GAMM|nr:sodium-dependent transporter [Psychrobacter frigidicola]TXD98250.1 sodium-dependent transporter [Psychrobacter frigidicola]